MASTSPGPWISSAEAAARLGVKPQTLYAYASRGLLHPRKAVDGRTSRYDVVEVERLGRVGRAGGDRQRRGAVDVRLTTGLTEITDVGPRYRGVAAVELARDEVPFEAVAEWLWTGGERPVARRLRAAERASWAPRLALVSGDAAPQLDLLVARAVAAAMADPDRADRRPFAVTATARHLMGDLVAALPGPGADRPDIASALWARLAGSPGSVRQRAALNGALVLLADHDIAASTLAARVAASTRADPYHVVVAGLAAVSGPLHGVASTLAVRLLAEVVQGRDAREVVDERLRLGERLPGFGHRVYPGTDPRFTALLDLVRTSRPDKSHLAAVDAVVDAAAERVDARPNIDLALAALVHGHGLPVTSGECIFAIARTAGWIAHALEEYDERPLRFRPQAVYVPAAATVGAPEERSSSSAPPARSGRGAGVAMVG